MTGNLGVLGQTVPVEKLEKDQSLAPTSVKPRKIMKQATADIANGLKDTDRGEQMNSIYKKLGENT